MVDWREDLILSDENLILGRLADLGIDAYELEAAAHRETLVAHALLRTDGFNEATRDALSNFDTAIRIQESLGCFSLAKVLTDLRADVSKISIAQSLRAENQLIVSYLLSGAAKTPA
jgi:hypothetical protein